MNVTVNSQLLAQELRVLNRIVPNKPPLPILGHVLLTARDGALHGYATNLEVGLSSSCDAQVHEAGACALPAAKLLQMTEQFPADDVHLATEGAHVGIACGRFRSRVQTYRHDDFPQQPEVQGAANKLDAASLRLLVARTRYAVSATSQKFVLMGALLTLKGNVAAMVATDGKRLALATCAREGGDATMVVPVKALDCLVDDSEEDVVVTAGPRHLFFAQGRRLLTSRTMDGEFPKYERVIPRGNDLTIEVDRAALTAALRRVLVVAEANEAVFLDVKPGALELQAQSSSTGAAAEALPAAYEGPALRACLNGGYLLEFLNAAAEQSTVIKLKEGGASALLQDGDSHLGVVMLMKDRK